jgi:hypothetical protein
VVGGNNSPGVGSHAGDTEVVQMCRGIKPRCPDPGCVGVMKLDVIVVGV